MPLGPFSFASAPAASSTFPDSTSPDAGGEQQRREAARRMRLHVGAALE
jgi:hypothetical protein